MSIFYVKSDTVNGNQVVDSIDPIDFDADVMSPTELLNCIHRIEDGDTMYTLFDMNFESDRKAFESLKEGYGVTVL